MNEDNEKISAWLDDAIEADEADSLQAMPLTGVYSTAARYRMIGDAIRGRIADASMIDISASVSEAIRREPELTPAARPEVVSRPGRKPSFGFGAWLRPIGGLAVAATVAMVMVVTLTDQQSQTGDAVVADAARQPVLSVPVNNVTPAYNRPGYALPAVNLNNYMTEHSEYAAQDTMQGMMPYARAVSYGSEKYPAIRIIIEDSQTVNYPSK